MIKLFDQGETKKIRVQHLSTSQWNNHERVMSILTLMIDEAEKNLRLKDSPKRPFMICKNNRKGILVNGFCGTSAIAHEIITTIISGKIPEETGTWKVYEISNECGRSARSFVNTFPKKDTT